MDQNSEISPEVFERIERYLLGRMPAAERQSFAAQLATDTQLQDHVQQVQLVMLGVQEAALSARLNNFHEEIPAVERKLGRIERFFPVKNWWAVASILFILVFLSWIFFFNKSKGDKIYEAYFKPDPGLMTTMGTTDNYTFDRAMVDYKTGHYAEAIGAWKTLLDHSPQNDTLNYFIGVAYVADGNALGGMYLEKVTNMPQSVFIKDAYWYLGFTLLQTGKTEAAIRAFRQSNHPQKEALLKALR